MNNSLSLKILSASAKIPLRDDSNLPFSAANHLGFVTRLHIKRPNVLHHHSSSPHTHFIHRIVFFLPSSVTAQNHVNEPKRRQRYTSIQTVHLFKGQIVLWYIYGVDFTTPIFSLVPPGSEKCH